MLRGTKRSGAWAFVMGGLVLAGCGAEVPESGTGLEGQEAPARLECGTPTLALDAEGESHLSAQAAGPRAIGSVTVPVYIHVINKGTGLTNGDVPADALTQQVAVLNSAFRDSPFVFSLVSVDRTTNATWFTAGQGSTAESQMKNALRKGTASALNLYTTSPGGGLIGWATFPSSYKANPKADGVVMHYGAMPGGSLVPYNLGNSTVHEVGHWLGLAHVEGCGGSDGVSDTPAYAWGPASVCTDGLDTCPANPGLDPVHNYMTYFDDACISEFTPGQVARMDSQAATYR
jgi:hypothetical protein